MKIGILTYHRSHNYGALLQAVALQSVLQRLGHNVSFIDYFPDYHKRMYALFDARRFRLLGKKAKLKYLRDFILTYPIRGRRAYTFNKFINKHIAPHTISMQEKFDCVVYGSDQIWRKQPELEDYNPIYFGDNKILTNKHVSYAASLVTLPSDIDDIEKFISLVRHLDSISVRETPVEEFLRHRGFPEVITTVDPTWLLSEKDWQGFFPKKRIIKKKYILLYDLIGEVTTSFKYSDVKLLANRSGLELVSLHALTSGRNSTYNRYTDGPEEFLNLVYNAECILTSSFHGLVFALLFHKNFYGLFVNDSQRAQSMLETVGLPDRLLTKEKCIPDTLENIDYSKVSELISKYKQSSMQYLLNL